MATSMTNLVVRVTLPKGLKLQTGAFMAENMSVEVIANLSPFYASVAECRLEGGPYMAKLKDTTIAAQIYRSSKEADQKQDRPPTPTTDAGRRFYAARNFWTTANAVYSLLVSLSGLVGYTGGHVLGNFSVTKQRGEQGTGFSAKIADLQQTLKEYRVVLESGGKVIPGGRPAAQMAAKGIFNDEVAPGRTWMTTGMGANASSPEFPSPIGGRGKPMKFYASPIVSCRYLQSMAAGAVSARTMLARYEQDRGGW